MTDDAPIPAAPYSLRRRLPSDVVVRSTGRFASYRNYPVFSAPWFWRRTALFGSVASFIGLMQSMLAWHLATATNAVIYTVTILFIWEVLIIVGPALATIARHRHLSPRFERIAVVVAILIGIACSFAAQYSVVPLQRSLLDTHVFEAITKAVRPSGAVAQIAQISVIGWQAAVFFVLSGGVALRVYFKEAAGWREAQRERELEALRQHKSDVDLKLTVLQAQVEPHFLFNTLASVHSLIRHDPQRAEATIEALVDHLRATLPKLRAGVGFLHSTLEEQLEVCASYLAVMEVRMGTRLRHEIDVPPALRAHHFPPFMLICLVENAIKHGIEPSPAGGCVEIRAQVVRAGVETSLEVSVHDNGMGLRPGLSDGVGLANLRAQLAAQFGARGRFSIESRAGGGVRATIAVPCAQGLA